MSVPTDIPAFAFHEADDGTSTWGGSWEPAHCSASGEPVVVEYAQAKSGLWVPRQAWVRDGKGYIDMYDCDFIESRGELYYHESGGGTPYVNGWMEPERLPGRIWIAEGAVVTCDGRSKRPLSDADLLARGIRRVHGPTPAPFDDAIEGDVLWCEDCKDYVPHEDGEGITACGRCSEQHHVHADGLIVAVDLDFDPAVYRVKGLWAPYEIECGYLGEDDVERVADIPADLRIASGDDAASLCRDCAAQILADRRLPHGLASEWSEDAEAMPDDRREALLAAVRERVDSWVAGYPENRSSRVHEWRAPQLAPRFGLPLHEMRMLCEEAGYPS